jgi:TonB family protein
MSAPQTTEIEPPSPYLPYTPAQREALDKSFFVGNAHYGTEVANEAINRSAVSKPSPPLSPAEREKLQKELHTGENDAAGGAGKEKVIREAAMSKRIAPLTAEEWKKLDGIYLVGSPHRGTDEAAKAIQAGALSLHIALADQQKALEAMYNVGRLARSNVGPVSYGRTEARLLAQAEPELPADLTDRAFSFAVVARLTVGVDGSVAEVVLSEPTPEPYLNQALVVALQKWRYYPAVDAGKPVASTVEIHFTISAPGVATDKKGWTSPDRGTSA